MANDANLNFSSDWDIDQIVQTGTVAIGSTGQFALTTLPASPTNPVFMVQFQPTGSAHWFQAGVSSDNDGANLFNFWGYTIGGKLYVNTGVTGTARYFVWTDKVDY